MHKHFKANTSVTQLHPLTQENPSTHHFAEQTIAHLYKCPLKHVSIKKNVQNQPILTIKHYPIAHYSLTHCQDITAFIFSLSPTAGIDIEIEKPRTHLICHENFLFTQEELRYLDTLDNKNAGFHRVWTQKEAVLKSQGHSIFDAHQTQLNQEHFISTKQTHALYQHIHPLHNISYNVQTFQFEQIYLSYTLGSCVNHAISYFLIDSHLNLTPLQMRSST